MGKSRKRVVFFFILVVLPVTVILFLQIFGENRFDLPEYFVEEVPEIDGCELSIPHRVNLVEFKNVKQGSLATVVAFPGTSQYEPELERISELLASSGVIELIVFTTKESPGIVVPKETFEELLECQFLYRELSEIETELPIFLIDKRGVIRGHYAGDDKIEIDRLITEVEIVKRYHE